MTDKRVSRNHAQLDCSNDNIVLTDTSTYGTWVYFDEGQKTELILRRNSCILNARGYLCLGMPFAENGVPVIYYQLHQEPG